MRNAIFGFVAGVIVMNAWQLPVLRSATQTMEQQTRVIAEQQRAIRNRAGN